MSDLPEGWEWVEIVDLASSLANGRSVPDGPANGYPVLRLTAIRSGTVDVTASKNGDWTAEDARAFKICEGDFLVARGNGSKHLVGRGGMVREGAEVAFPDTMIRIRFDQTRVRPMYAALIWDAPQIRTQIEIAARTSAGIYKISQKDLRKIRIALPGLSEQDRVIAVIEEQLSRLDAGVVALRQGLHHLKRIRTSLLQVTVARARELGAIDIALDDLIQHDRKIAYGVLVPGEHDPEGIALVRVGDIDNRRIAGNLKRISRSIDARFPRTQLRGGEVLLSLVGTIGRTAVVPLDLAGANVARALAVIPLREKIEPSYVAIVLGRDQATRELTALSHEVARKTLNLEDVRRYKIPIPGNAEQLQLVNEVETGEAWIESMEKIITNSLRRSERLRMSILEAAFSGRLGSRYEATI